MPASPNTISAFPVEYLEAIDEVLAGATFAGRYNVQGAEFVNGRTVSVPDIDFGNSPDPTAYSRFSSESGVTIARTPYTLDHDVEKVFYVDAAEAADEPAVAMTNVVSEYERTVFGPYVDKGFFAKAKAQALAKGTTTLIAWLGLRDVCPPEGETPKTATIEAHDSMTYARTHDGGTIRVYVVTDPDTCVQYVVSDRGGVTPRLRRDGTPMGVVTE